MWLSNLFKRKNIKPKFFIGDKVVIKSEKEICKNRPHIGEIICGEKTCWVDTGEYFVYDIRFDNQTGTKRYAENNLESFII